MYIKNVLTRNSMYVIDEEAETVTRNPIMGDGMEKDCEPISFLSYEAKIGEPLRIIHIRDDGSVFTRITTEILTIATVGE